jgi:hypothetical protein
MKRKRLQLSLLLLCVLLLYTHGVDFFGKTDLWSTGYTLEISASDIGNHDSDGNSSPVVLLTALIPLADKKSISTQAHFPSTEPTA